jgi:polysaccharide biosynthesis transport protein
MVTADDSSFQQQTYVIRSRKWTVLSVALVGALVAVALSVVRSPSYVSTATVLVTGSTNGIDSPSAPSTVAGPDMNTELKLATQPSVAQLAAATLRDSGGGVDVLRHISVDVPIDTDILEFNYAAATPEAAKSGAQAFAGAYLQYRRSQNIKTLTQESQSLQARVAILTKQLGSLQRRASRTTDRNQKSLLQSQITNLAAQIAALQQKLADADPTQYPGVGQIAQPASLPRSPSRVNPLLAGVVGLVFGLILGIGVALLREYLDDTLQNAGHLQAELGLPVFGVIPRRSERGLASRLGGRGGSDLAAPDDQAYRQLARNLLSNSALRSVRALMLVDPAFDPHAGPVVLNLARAMASFGKRVVLLDANAELPAEHLPREAVALLSAEDIARDPTVLGSALAQAQPDRVVVVRAVDKPSGPIGVPPAERLRPVMGRAKEVGDIVLVSAPPLDPYGHSDGLTRICDAVLLVISQRTTAASDIRRASQQLADQNAHLVGGVLVEASRREASRGNRRSANPYPYPQKQTSSNGNKKKLVLKP